jgi:ferric-dicitrate binding protein FerR (iron transport regulator)
MKMQPANIMDDELLMKYLTGNLTAEESETFRLSMEAEPANRKYLEQMELIWKSSGSIREFQSIDAAKDWNSLRERFGFSKQPEEHHPSRQIRRMTFRIMRVAAIILLAFASAFMIYYYTGNLSKMDWITLDAPDQLEEITLPDGSRVSLNTGSRLAYPAEFKGRKRTVKLEGEAFFEVARNEDRAFIVIVADEASTEVLGTSFHLREDPGKKRVFLNVLTGKVAFYPKGKKKKALVLGKDEHAEYHNGHIQQHVSLDLNFLSWKTRTLIFDNSPLPQVLKQLGKHYHKEFHIMDRGLDTLALTGTYKNQKIDNVLEEISLVLDIAFEEADGRIQVRAFSVQTNEE